MAYGNNLFVISTNSGTFLSSPDGTNWTSRNASSKYHAGIFYLNDKFIATGQTGSVLVSSDGITWTSKSANSNIDLSGIASK